MADKDDFFEEKEEKVEENQEAEIEKVKVGEDEYTQEELNNLIGLGKIAQEAEDKYNRPIRKFWPEYTKQNQELTELREKISQMEASNKEEKPASPGGLTDQQKEEIRKSLQDILGDEPLTKKQFNQFYSSNREAERLLESVDRTIADARSKGFPETSSEELLTYMNENGVRSPSIAYKLMFEEQLDKMKEEKLASLRPSGLNTTTGSTAGSKAPPPPQPVTTENLGDSLRGFLRTRNQG